MTKGWILQEARNELPRCTIPTEPIIDELLYRAYAFNRRMNPSVAVNRWMLLFENVPEMEVRYQMEKR